MSVLTPFFLLAAVSFAPDANVEWERTEIQPGGRIDAIADFGEGVVVLGTRNPHPSHVFRSSDYGKTWTHVASLDPEDYITCVASGPGDTGYILTGEKAHVWKTTDDGITWHDLGKVTSPKKFHNFARTYGMVVTPSGTILVADTHADGGRITRSTDGGKTWQTSPSISTDAIYRLQLVGDGILANGWAGNIYKSTDDGLTWTDRGQLMDSYLYAIDYLGNNEVLIGTESSHIFHSADNGDTWTNLGPVSHSSDDFVSLGNGHVIFTTYRETKTIHYSADSGRTWTSLGNVGTGVEGDWFDHVIALRHDEKTIIVGGTHQGFVLRYEID